MTAGRGGPRRGGGRPDTNRAGATRCPHSLCGRDGSRAACAPTRRPVRPCATEQRVQRVREQSAKARGLAFARASEQTDLEGVAANGAGAGGRVCRRFGRCATMVGVGARRLSVHTAQVRLVAGIRHLRVVQAGAGGRVVGRRAEAGRRAAWDNRVRRARCCSQVVVLVLAIAGARVGRNGAAPQRPATRRHGRRCSAVAVVAGWCTVAVAVRVAYGHLAVRLQRRHGDAVSTGPAANFGSGSGSGGGRWGWGLVAAQRQQLQLCDRQRWYVHARSRDAIVTAHELAVRPGARLMLEEAYSVGGLTTPQHGRGRLQLELERQQVAGCRRGQPCRAGLPLLPCRTPLTPLTPLAVAAVASPVCAQVHHPDTCRQLDRRCGGDAVNRTGWRDALPTLDGRTRFAGS